jgi:tetratricopeptide (TPR) repeat protein
LNTGFLRQSQPHDATLRQRLGDGISALEAVRGEPEAYLSLLGELGAVARTLEEWGLAERWLTEALTLAQTLGDRAREAANLIRLGTLYHYRGDVDRGMLLFSQALSLSDHSEAASYRDFALQHMGKLLVEQGLYQEAYQCFMQALQLRERKGEASLISSTQEALQALESLLTSEIQFY